MDFFAQTICCLAVRRARFYLCSFEIWFIYKWYLKSENNCQRFKLCTLVGNKLTWHIDWKRALDAGLDTAKWLYQLKDKTEEEIKSMHK